MYGPSWTKSKQLFLYFILFPFQEIKEKQTADQEAVHLEEYSTVKDPLYTILLVFHFPFVVILNKN